MTDGRLLDDAPADRPWLLVPRYATPAHLPADGDWAERWAALYPPPAADDTEAWRPYTPALLAADPGVCTAWPEQRALRARWDETPAGERRLHRCADRPDADWFHPSRLDIPDAVRGRCSCGWVGHDRTWSRFAGTLDEAETQVWVDVLNHMCPGWAGDDPVPPAPVHGPDVAAWERLYLPADRPPWWPYRTLWPHGEQYATRSFVPYRVGARCNARSEAPADTPTALTTRAVPWATQQPALF